MANYNASVTFNLVDKFSTGLTKIQSGITSFSTQNQKTLSSMKKAWDKFNDTSGASQTAANLSLASQAFANTANQLNALVSGPKNIAAAFETGMARVSTVLTTTNAIGGDTTSTMSAIENAARRMSGGISQAGQLASVGMETFTNSVYTMLSSGLQTNQAIAATEQAALLAKATGGAMSDAASALTGVFNNLGNKSADAGTEMTRLSDIIAGTQNYFAFENLEQFTAGLKNVSGVAVSNKIPLTQLSAAIGQLNTNMIKGPEAGTALKSVIAQLGNASTKLGFDIAKTSDGGIDLIATLNNIKATGADGQQLLKAFGTEAGPAIGLLTANFSELENGLQAVNNSAGITLSNASKMADTFNAKSERLSNSWQVLSQRIGVGSIAVSSIGVSIGLAATQTMNWLTALPGLGQGLASVAGGVGTVTGGLLNFVAGNFQFLAGLNAAIALGSKIGPLFTLITGSVKIFTSGIFGLAKAFIVGIPSLISWTVTAWSAAAAHIAVAWPIYAVVAGIAALTAGVVLVVKHWGTLVGWLKSAWQWFNNLLNNKFIKNALLIFAPIITVPALIIKHWQPIKEFFLGIWNVIKGVGSAIGGFFSKLFGGQNTTPVVELAGARALGGPVSAGSTYMVGENGPELFTPNNGGNITSNQQLQSGKITIHIDSINMSAPNDLQHFINLVKEFAIETMGGQRATA